MDSPHVIGPRCWILTNAPLPGRASAALGQTRPLQARSVHPLARKAMRSCDLSSCGSVNVLSFNIFTWHSPAVYHAPVSVPSLMQDQAVRLIIAVAHSRRAAKTYLYEQGIRVGADELDAFINDVQLRRDFAVIQDRVAKQRYAVETVASVEFDPLVDLRRELMRRGESPDAFATRINSEQSIDASEVRRILDGDSDPPLSLFVRLLAAAGAKRVQFDPSRA